MTIRLSEKERRSIVEFVRRCEWIRLGERLRKQRMGARLSLTDVATEAGIDKARLSRIETGKARTYADEVSRIEQVLRKKRRK